MSGRMRRTECGRMVDDEMRAATASPPPLPSPFREPPPPPPPPAATTPLPCCRAVSRPGKSDAPSLGTSPGGKGATARKVVAETQPRCCTALSAGSAAAARRLWPTGQALRAQSGPKSSSGSLSGSASALLARAHSPRCPDFPGRGAGLPGLLLFVFGHSARARAQGQPQGPI